METLNPATRSLVAELLGLEGMPESLQDEAIEAVGESVEVKVALTILERLPETAQEEYKKLSEAGDTAGAQALAEGHIPELAVLVRAIALEEVSSFREKLAK